MAINFPDSPSLNQIFNDTTSGFSFQWNGEVWKSYVDPTIGNTTKLDDISASFNGSTQTFALTVNGTAATADLDPAKILLSLGGVAQNPVEDYTISGTNITFTTAPANGLTFFAVILETGISKDYISSGIIGPTGLSTGGFSWNTGGDLYISGVATVANTGTATTALYVSGNARIAGILTVGSSSITFDGTNNRITGTGITISSGGIVASAITATSYSGDGANLTGAGLGPTSNINTTGIITASKFSGDATYLTDIGGVIQGIVYNPTVGATGIAATTNIDITFNKPIKAGIGTITLRTDSASGSIVESYDITSSNRLTISGAKLTIDPTSNLGAGTTHFVVVPAGTVKDLFNTGSNAVIDTYSFTTQSFTLFSFGRNPNGQLGQNDTVRRSSPTQIPGTQWSYINSANYHSLATKTDGTLWAWGSNAFGKLGLNNTTYCSSPVQIPGTSWRFISSDYNTTIATKTDGTLWAWGNNGAGELGQSNTYNRSSPIQIPGTQWGNISATASDTFATKTDGTLWSWGYNSYGQLGQNDRVNRSSPIQIPGTQWNNIQTGFYSTFATKTDGTLWAWGYNHRGQLGQNNTTYRSSPVQIPGTSWNSIGGFLQHFLATKTDGTLWSWGYNNAGRLGQNDTVFRSSPVQVPGTQWSSISAGGQHSLATKTDGTLWAWGRNYFGELGANTSGSAAYRSSPIQIPGTSWSSVSAGYQSSSAIKSQ